MQELIVTLEKLLSKSPLDYALDFVPIAISFVAIWVSVSTTRKQNKIAMFELRYKCISQIRTIISYEGSINGYDDPVLLLCLYDALWGTDISNKGFDERIIKTRCNHEAIYKDVMQAEVLFKHTFQTNLPDLLKCMQILILEAINGEVNETTISKFGSLCKTLHDKDLPHMLKQLNCKNL